MSPGPSALTRPRRGALARAAIHLGVDRHRVSPAAGPAETRARRLGLRRLRFLNASAQFAGRLHAIWLRFCAENAGSIRKTGAMQKFLDLLKRFHNGRTRRVPRALRRPRSCSHRHRRRDRRLHLGAERAHPGAGRPRCCRAGPAAEDLQHHLRQRGGDGSWPSRPLAKALLIDRLNDSKITIVGDLVADADKTPARSRSPQNSTPRSTSSSLVGIKEMNMTLVSQATKGSQDLEVAVALDVTGSMDRRTTRSAR